MALYDRDYMRPARRSGVRFRFRRPRLSATLALALVLIAAFVAQMFATGSGHGDFIREHLCFNARALKSGEIQVLITSAFLHAGIGHIFANVIGVWCFGRGVEQEHGAKRFWRIFLGGSLAGTLLTALIWCLPAPLIAKSALLSRDGFASLGASCGIMALGGYFFADKLREEFTALIYFILPVRVSGRIFLGVLGGLSLAGLLCSEIPLATGWWRVVINETNISHSGHLGGLLFGFVLRRMEMAGRLKARSKLRVFTPEPRVSPERETERRFPSAPSTTKDLRSEVDRILDKINRQGFGSLSPEDRDTLEKARQTLNR